MAICTGAAMAQSQGAPAQPKDTMARPLAPVTIEGTRRPRPSRAAERDPWNDGGSTIQGVLDPELAGDLSSLGSLTPGLIQTRDGLSVLGGRSQQLNTIGLDGVRLLTNGSVAPGMFVRFGTVPGANGTQITATPSSTSNMRNAFTGFIMNLPRPEGIGPTRRYASHARIEGIRSGPFEEDKIFYLIGYRLAQSWQERPALSQLSPAAANFIGVAPDTLSRLLSILDGYGLRALPGSPNRQARTSGSLLMRVQTPENATRMMLVNAMFNWQRNNGVGAYALAMPSANATATSWSAAVHGKYSWYTRNAFLHDTKFGVSYRTAQTAPYQTMPAMLVDIQSQQSQDDISVLRTQAAGQATPASHDRDVLANAAHVVTWHSINRAHRWAAELNAAIQTTRRSVTSATPGMYRYASLADLEGNRPVSFSRIFDHAPQTAAGTSIAFSLSDTWRARPNVSIGFGTRISHTRMVNQPHYNALADTLLGVDTRHIPSSFAISPRWSVQWTPLPRQNTEARSWIRTSSVSAGMGAFMDDLSLGMASHVLALTGLPTSQGRLECIGDAVPVPSWSPSMSSPGACLDGTPALQDSMPNVTAFGSGYRLDVVWQGMLRWSGRVQESVSANIGVTYRQTTHMLGTLQRNMGNTMSALPAENGRFMAVGPESIDPATGIVLPGASRAVSQFGTVSTFQSDEQMRAWSVSSSFGSGEFFRGVSWQVEHSWTRAWELTRGWETATQGHPNTLSWGRSQTDGMHQVVGMINFGNILSQSVTLTAVALSGLRFTPLVSGDVNGDGVWNDAAFIVRPDAGSEDAVARSMAQLLQNAPGYVRSCLSRQVAHVASRNSCRGPGWMRLNASGTLRSGFSVLGRRPTVRIHMNNILSGIDQIVHGRTNMRGWGQMPFVDPMLLSVQGFNPVARAYVYTVNGNFGQPYRGITSSPFSLSVGFFFSTDFEAELFRMTVTERKGKRERVSRPAADIKRGYLNETKNAYAMVLSVADTLQLRPEQVTVIGGAAQHFATVADSVWGAVAAFLAGMQPFDPERGLAAVKEARARIAPMERQAVEQLKAVLSAEQFERMPGRVRRLFRPQEPDLEDMGFGGFEEFDD